MTQYTGKSELFMEYGSLVRGMPEELIIHLTRTSDFTPITTGSLEIRLVSSSGETYSVRKDEPARDGIFLPIIEPPFSGNVRMELELNSSQLKDIQILENVTVSASPSELPHVAAEEENPEALSFLKEQQWKIDFANEPALRRGVKQSIPAVATFRIPSGGQAILPAPSSGIVRFAPGSDSLEVGRSVTGKQGLFLIESEAYWRPDLSQLREDYILAKSELERVGRLQEQEAVSARRVEEARIRFDTLQSAIERLGGNSVPGDDSSFQAEAAAPISGIASEVFVVSGQRVEAGDPLALIVNPERLILEAHVLPSRLPHGEPITDLTFYAAPGGQPYRISELNGQPLSKSPVASGQNNMAMVRFILDNPDGRFIPGAKVSAHLLAGDSNEERVAVPVAAIHEENGVPIVYVQTGGETIEKRTPRLGASDGIYTQVLSGIEPGERVVTKGGAFIRLSSLSTTEMGHGHAH
ncbi:MAG: HlyD family efflux transporter periplasmic adaptor subunit [Opitutales bacterium]